MDTEQNSADTSSGNAMAWRETPGVVQPNARVTLHALELTNGHFSGHIQIAIPKPPSTDSIHPSSSHCENANSEGMHPSQSTNAKNLKRKRTGDDAARASKRAPSPTFYGGRLADLRGPPMPTQPEVPPNNRYRLTNPPTYTPKAPREKTSNSSASPREVPPVDTFEFLKWVRSQTVGYAPADTKRMLSAIRCLRDPDTRELGFGIALKILGRHIATLVEEAKEMKIMYDKVQKSSGPCAESILQTLEQGSRQIDKRRDDFAERVRALKRRRRHEVG